MNTWQQSDLKSQNMVFKLIWNKALILQLSPQNSSSRISPLMPAPTKRELLNTCANTLDENKKLWFEVPQPASLEKIIYPVLDLAIHQTQSPLKDPKSDLLSREEIFKQRNSKLSMLSGLRRSQKWNLIYDQVELLHEALQLMMHLLYNVQKANMDPFQNFMKVLDILITWASNNHS